VVSNTRKEILTVSELLKSGKKIARLVGNRDLNPKVVKTKKVSLKENGLLIPAVIVDAIDAIEQGLEIVDFETGEAITKDNASDYVVLVDANNRYKAHLELKEEDEEYTGEFYAIYPLDPNMKIVYMLTEINITTSTYKGSDYVKAAALAMKDEPLNLLNGIDKLTSRGFSLESASLWLSFMKIGKSHLVKVINGEWCPELENESGIERGQKLLKVAERRFHTKALQTRIIPGWIVSKYEETSGDDESTFYSKNGKPS